MKKNNFISDNQNNEIEKELSDWQMYQMSINRCGIYLACLWLDAASIGSNAMCNNPIDLASRYLLKSSYSYDFFLNSSKSIVSDFLSEYRKPTKLQKNKFIRDFIYEHFLYVKYLHNILQMVNDYDDYFFAQGPSSISLHFDALETSCNKNTIIKDFNRDELDENIDKKRTASRYQTLSFYDYDYFYQDKAPDETAVDFWLAMDRFLEEPYLTQENMKQDNCEPDEEMRAKNAKNKDKLRNYVHKIMIVPDELLNNNEKKFRTWVRNPENQKKFVAVYQKTFNKVPKTGLKKIEGDIENQKETIKSKLLFCKQKMTFKNQGGKKEEKFVYSLKLLNDGEWIECPNNKCEKYSEVWVKNPGINGKKVITLEYELDAEEELYEFPNMEYLTYLLHANPNGLSEIEKEFVAAFLDRSASKQFSLGAQIHEKNIKQYVHDNLITGRKNWKLKSDEKDNLFDISNNSVEDGLSDKDIKILNLLNDDERINKFNESFDKVYNKYLFNNLCNKVEEKRELKEEIDNFAKPSYESEQYDLGQEFYKIVKLCNEKEMQEKNKLPVTITITFNWFKFFKGLVIAFILSLVIFIASKFIFDVIAIWALIIFPVVPVLIFFACVFFLKDKFRKITYPYEICALKNENGKKLILSKDKIENQQEEEIEKIGRKEGQTV